MAAQWDAIRFSMVVSILRVMANCYSCNCPLPPQIEICYFGLAVAYRRRLCTGFWRKPALRGCSGEILDQKGGGRMTIYQQGVDCRNFQNEDSLPCVSWVITVCIF
ncbi:hypothetical protein BJV82DRAFT_125237 [Fennellomyces sp. T-0311]|nr:hypothetical protein BJV82DRAFT_125237 [Fennellomyces sp. T-0311]